MPGSTIAVTAPSSGVFDGWRQQFESTLKNLRQQGYRIVEGECLYGGHKYVSATAKERAAELMSFLQRDDIDAVYPPCGGDLAVELLPLLDFEDLANQRPKWMLGFSDISALLLPLTTISGWATAHGDNLYERGLEQHSSHATDIERVLQTEINGTVEQSSSSIYMAVDYSTPPPRQPVPKETQWKVISTDTHGDVIIKGRLIGGCLDRIARLAGTKFGNVPKFLSDHAKDGVVLHLENAGMWPTEFARTLITLRMSGWFDSVNGVMFGRSSGADTTDQEAYSYLDAIQSSLDGIGCPILYDVDIGHQLPQLTLIQGATAEVRVGNGKGSISQTFN